MIYNKKMEDTDWIIIKLENMEEIVLEKTIFDNMNILLLNFPKSFTYENNITLANGNKLRLKNSKLFIVCDQIEISKDSINIHALYFPYVEKHKIILEDGTEAVDIALVYSKDNDFVLHVDDGIEYIDVDSKLWVDLLNNKLVYGEEDALKHYDLLPKTRIYETDSSGKKKIKKYIK